MIAYVLEQYCDSNIYWSSTVIAYDNMPSQAVFKWKGEGEQ